MPYRIEFEPPARRALARLPTVARQRVLARIEALADDPRPRGVVKLAGADRAYRLRVGELRVIYEIHDEVLLAVIIRIGHRRDIYGRE
jgi:mRNA interferase RelE/StbE